MMMQMRLIATMITMQMMLASIVSIMQLLVMIKTLSVTDNKTRYICHSMSKIINEMASLLGTSNQVKVLNFANLKIWKNENLNLESN